MKQNILFYFYDFFINHLHSDPQAKWRTSVRGCKWLELHHRIHDSAAPQSNTIPKIKFLFFGSYRFCVVAYTKIGDQVLVAVNGSGYVIENRILQHLMITRIQKYF